MESSDASERLALIASDQVLASVDVGREDLADPDVRAVVIRADHPELDRALADGQDEVQVNGEPVSIRLHLQMHQVLATQLVDDEPPEVFQTARRLLAAGYERHEMLHMLAAPVSNQIYAMLSDGEPYDRARHIAELKAMPDSWERQRAQGSLTRTDPQGRHTARRRRH